MSISLALAGGRPKFARCETEVNISGISPAVARGIVFSRRIGFFERSTCQRTDVNISEDNREICQRTDVNIS